MLNNNLKKESKMNIKNATNKTNPLLTSLVAVPACQIAEADSDWFPSVDLTETGQEYCFEVDLSGLKPEEIELRVHRNSLSISGHRRPKPPCGNRLRVERPSGDFVRHLPLPRDAGGEIHATFGDGVLELRVSRGASENGPRPEPAVAREPEEVLH
jgi:HSP20 family molecular chaperone IbpA